jgi:hypothetical protein
MIFGTYQISEILRKQPGNWLLTDTERHDKALRTTLEALPLLSHDMAMLVAQQAMELSMRPRPFKERHT